VGAAYAVRVPDARPPSPRGLGYLPGIDGLRAVSVIAVLLYHADLTWIPGGFLGVEVFFVISGYLITLLLVTEFESTGTVSLRSFWARRARRLLPALYLLLLAVVAVAASFYREELSGLRGQVGAALAYVTNWYEIVIGGSYFDAAGRPPFLRHLWSLAVEEQFYLVWPVVLFGLIRLTRNRRLPLALIVLGGAVASTWWMASLYEPAQDPTRVYYGTDTRASGLLLGAVLAFVWRPSERRGRRPLGPDLATLTGLGALVFCFLTFKEWERSLYQGGFALVGVLTVVAIAGLVHPAGVIGPALLGNRLMTWIGVRSYGLYLWHWPIFVMTRPEVDLSWTPGPTLALRLAATVVAAELSYRFVEMPIRRGALGRWFQELRTADGSRRLVRTQLTVVVALVVAALAVPATVRLVSVDGASGSLTVSAVDDVSGQEVETESTESTEPSGDTRVVQPTAPATPSATGAAAASTAEPASALAGAPLTGSAATITVIGDSVLMRIKDDLTEDLEARGWTVDYRGEAALMLDDATTQLRAENRPVGDTVVLGLGYNSLWERGRARYTAWADKFDTEANELLQTLTDLGAKRFVWVNLREPVKAVIPKKSMKEYDRYAWYFPYVNERIDLLAVAYDNLVIADWRGVANVPGITGDLIHLNQVGYRLMRDTILEAGGL
jgi:peptidoglycan/LPS O-acetylase OafA/YrhL